MPRLHPSLAASAALAVSLLVPCRAQAQSPWVIDANIGALRIKSTDDFQFTGSATLGYATPQLGLVGSGSYSAYAFNTAQQTSEYKRAEGQGEGWFLFGGGSSSTRFELRVTGGGISYDSQSNFLNPDGTSSHFINDTLWMGRGTLFAGLSARPDETVSLEAILGGGFQYVFLDDHLDTAPDAPLILNDTESLSVQGQARLSLRWSFLPGTLGTRLQSRLAYFLLNRSTTSFNNDTNSFDVKVESRSQLEVFSKLFLDVEALAFFGITPGAYVGLDFIRTTGDTTLSTTVPSAGLGLFKDVK